MIEAGAKIINVPDTVGYAVPWEFGKLIYGIRKNVPNIHKAIISVHCHDDLGLAVANSLAAVENGAQQIEVAINGLGERAGNASLEEVVMTLNTFSDFFRNPTRIDTTQIYRTSRLVSTLTGIDVPPNKAIVGVNAFAHESGIHQHGVLEEKTTYEIIKPETIGLSANRLVLGKHSGRHAFKEKIKEMGYNLEDSEIEKAFKKFKDLADKKKEITEKDIEALIEEEVIAVPETFKLEYLQATSGSGVVASAVLKLNKNGVIIEEAACGEGPVDAVYKAIDRACGGNFKLIDYTQKQ